MKLFPSDYYSALEFPVILVTSRDVRASYTLAHLRSYDSGLFKAGYCRRGSIVDSKLSCFNFKRTEKIGYAPPFWGFRLDGGRFILIEYDLNSPVQISLDELQTLITKSKKGLGYNNPAKGISTFEDLVEAFGRRPKPGWWNKWKELLWPGAFG